MFLCQTISNFGLAVERLVVLGNGVIIPIIIYNTLVKMFIIPAGAVTNLTTLGGNKTILWETLAVWDCGMMINGGQNSSSSVSIKWSSNAEGDVEEADV